MSYCIGQAFGIAATVCCLILLKKKRQMLIAIFKYRKQKTV